MATSVRSPWPTRPRWRRRSSTPWRHALDEAVRRYLRLQIELGGSEVVLSEPDRRTGGPADVEADVEADRRTGGQRSGQADRPILPSARPPVRPSASKDW